MLGLETSKKSWEQLKTGTRGFLLGIKMPSILLLTDLTLFFSTFVWSLPGFSSGITIKLNILGFFLGIIISSEKANWILSKKKIIVIINLIDLKSFFFN